jgi:hypothetical protein
MLSPIAYPLLSKQPSQSPALNFPPVSLDEEPSSSKAHSPSVEEDPEKAWPTVDSSESLGRSFINPHLQETLGMSDVTAPFQRKTARPSFNTTGASERLPDEVMLDTVRKRQANLAISTQDVYNDFKKTAQLLGADVWFDDLLHSHFTLVNQEARQAVQDEKWIKTVLMRLAKVLDDTVSNTLEEPSKVVGEWLDALFTQPIEWTPMDLAHPASSTQATIAPSKPTTASQPTEELQAQVATNRVNHLVMKDGLKRVYTALQSKQWEVAEHVIAEVFQHVSAHTMPLHQRQQWQSLQFKLWQKQGKSDKILAQALAIPSPEQSPELTRFIAEAYAQTGDYKQAIRTLHPLLAMPRRAEKQPAPDALKSWQRLATWAKALQNPALEHKMLEGYFNTTKTGVAPAEVALEPLKRLQVLEQLMGRDAKALSVVQERVHWAKAQRNKTAYVSALQDVAALLLSQGEAVKAQKVLALL